MQQWEILTGDCLELMQTIPAGSIDAVITDPPYPEIDREYGRLSEADWFALMRGVVEQTRRVLKPTGSAVYILQPNSRKVGSMRTWLWRFLLEIAEDWNLIQDVYWWNTSAPPNVHTQRINGLTKPGVKHCIWAGPADAYRDQDAILETAAESTIRDNRKDNDERIKAPSGYSKRQSRSLTTHIERGGVVPFNVLPIAAGSGKDAGAYGHGAGTPLALADWWTRYIVPPGGRVLDPFVGSGTMAIAAIQNGATAIGIDKMEKYTEIARARLEKTQPSLFLAAD